MNDRVVAAGGEHGAVGAEGHDTHRSNVAAQCPRHLTGGDVPKLDGAVASRRRHVLLIRTKGQREDAARMRGRVNGARRGVRIPQRDDAIVAGTGDALAVVTEDGAVDDGGMSAEDEQLAPGGDVPDLDEVLSAAGADEQLAIGTESDAVGAAGMR